MNRLLVTAGLGCLASVASVAAEDFLNPNTGDVQACVDVDAFNNPECYKNMVWAQLTGIERNITWYPAGATTLTDFQCALTLKSNITGVDESGDNWNCSKVPCAYVSADFSWVGGTPDQAGTRLCRHVPPPPVIVPTTTTTTTEAPASVPVWGWALIAVAVIGALAAVAVLATRQQKPKKKKRALKPAPPPPAPEPQPTVAEPLPMYTPVYTQAPVYSHVQPVATYAAPQPVITTAQPVSTMSYMPATQQGSYVAAPQQAFVQPQQAFVQQQAYMQQPGPMMLYPGQ